MSHFVHVLWDIFRERPKHWLCVSQIILNKYCASVLVAMCLCFLFNIRFRLKQAGYLQNQHSCYNVFICLFSNTFVSSYVTAHLPLVLVFC